MKLTKRDICYSLLYSPMFRKQLYTDIIISTIIIAGAIYMVISAFIAI